MAEPLTIEGEIDSKSQVPVITLNWGPEGMLQSTGSELSGRLITEYKGLLDKSAIKSLVLDIKAETAGSPLIRALVDVYRYVDARKGLLICAGYPRDFLPALNALGVTSLPGFQLVGNRDDAVRRASSPQ